MYLVLRVGFNVCGTGRLAAYLTLLGLPTASCLFAHLPTYLPVQATAKWRPCLPTCCTFNSFGASFGVTMCYGRRSVFYEQTTALGLLPGTRGLVAGVVRSRSTLCRFLLFGSRARVMALWCKTIAYSPWSSMSVRNPTFLWSSCTRACSHVGRSVPPLRPKRHDIA